MARPGTQQKEFGRDKIDKIVLGHIWAIYFYIGDYGFDQSVQVKLDVRLNSLRRYLRNLMISGMNIAKIFNYSVNLGLK